MPPPDPDQVRTAAAALIAHHGDAALEIAKKTAEVAENPEFAAAVIVEIERRLSATRH